MHQTRTAAADSTARTCATYVKGAAFTLGKTAIFAIKLRFHLLCPFSRCYSSLIGREGSDVKRRKILLLRCVALRRPLIRPGRSRSVQTASSQVARITAIETCGGRRFSVCMGGAQLPWSTNTKLMTNVVRIISKWDHVF